MSTRDFLTEALLHKYTVEQTQTTLVSYSILLLTNDNNWSEHYCFLMHFQTFFMIMMSHFGNYSSNHISKVFKAPSQSAKK